jgi:hypothetical protein
MRVGKGCRASKREGVAHLPSDVVVKLASADGDGGVPDSEGAAVAGAVQMYARGEVVDERATVEGGGLGIIEIDGTAVLITQDDINNTVWQGIGQFE